MTDEIINVMLKANDRWCADFDGFDDDRSRMVAILSALEAAGYAVVPVEPTRNMLIAFSNTLLEPKLRYCSGRVKDREGYKAMIAAVKETGDE